MRNGTDRNWPVPVQIGVVALSERLRREIGDVARSTLRPPKEELPDDDVSEGCGMLPGMEQRLTMITLGVTDLEAARRFYLGGLGWRPVLDAGEAVFLQVGAGVLLALYGRADLAAEAGTSPGPIPPPPFSLAHNVATEAEVRRVVTEMEAAGGTVVAPPARAPWGGYTAYVADPDGFRWEIAHNPGLVISADGMVRFDGA